MTKGRKRKPNVKRVNGRISQRADDKQAQRSLEEKDVMAVAREGRERVFGVDPRDSGTDLAGSLAGRLCLTGQIRREQFNAAMRYIEDVENYRWAMDGPRQPGAVNLQRGDKSEPAPDDVAFVLSSKKSYIEMARVVQETANHHRGANLFAALYYFLMRDEFHAHMLGDLRIALNALARHYRITEGIAA